MNRFPTYIPTYTSKEDTLVNPTSPLYICVSPPIDENRRVTGFGSSCRRNISDSSSTRLFPPPRSRYHSWYSGSPLTGRNTFDSYRLSSVPDEESSDVMYRSTSLSPSTSRGTRYRPTSFSPYGLKDHHPDHSVQRMRYISSAPTSPSIYQSLPGRSRKDLHNVKDSTTSSYSRMDPVSLKNRSLYNNVDPTILHDYADSDDTVSCFGNFGCGTRRNPAGQRGTSPRRKFGTLPRYVKEKISPLFTIASRCTSASPVTSVSDTNRRRALTRSASSDDLQTLELDLGAAVLYIDVRKGKTILGFFRIYFYWERINCKDPKLRETWKNSITPFWWNVPQKSLPRFVHWGEMNSTSI